MSSNPQNRSVFFVLLFIVLIVATFFRIYNLNITPPGLYPDEAMNGTNAQEAIATGEYKLFYPENNGREGLFINIQAFALKLFGVNEPWVLRSVSAIFGILAVLGLFLLIRVLFRIAKKDARMGILGAFSGSFLMAVSFWHVNFSRIGFRAIMAPFFIIWAMYLLLKGFEDYDVCNRKKLSISLIFVSGLVFGLGMHSYIAYRALPIFVLLVFVFYWKLFSVSFKKILTRFGVFVIGSLITSFPLFYYFIQNPQDFLGRTSQISIFSSGNPILNLIINFGKSIMMFFWFGDANWRHNFSNAGQLYPLVSILFIVGIVVGIARTSKYFSKKAKATFGGDLFIFLFSISLFFVALLPTIISSEGIPHALRAILVIPAAFILVAVGFVHILELINKSSISEGLKNKLLVSFFVIFLLIPAAHTFYLYFIDWGNRQEVRNSFAQNYVYLADEINNADKDVDKYIVVHTGGVLVRGIPMPTQTVMFLTDSFTQEKQLQKKIKYILPNEESSIPSGSLVFHLR